MEHETFDNSNLTNYYFSSSTSEVCEDKKSTLSSQLVAEMENICLENSLEWHLIV